MKSIIIVDGVAAKEGETKAIIDEAGALVTEEELVAVEKMPMSVFLALLVLLDMSEKTPEVFREMVRSVRGQTRLSSESESVISNRGIETREGMVINEAVVLAIINYPDLDRVFTVLNYHGKLCLEELRG